MTVAVIYASKHGSTRDVAIAIAHELRCAGLEAEVCDAAGLSKLPAANAYIFGSAVYARRWLKPGTRLIEEASSELRDDPVWLFSVGPAGDAEQQAKMAPDVSAIVEATDARGHEVFAGRLDLEDLSLGERLLARATKAPLGDFRDWDAIRRWSRAVARELAEPAMRRGPASGAATGSSAAAVGPARVLSTPNRTETT